MKTGKIIFSFLVMLTLLLTACSDQNDTTITIEPSKLFKGDATILEPHLGINGGAVKVHVPGSEKLLKTSYSIWKNGVKESSHDSFSVPLEGNSSAEVSVSLQESFKNPEKFDVCIAVKDMGYTKFQIPRFNNDFYSRNMNHLNYKMEDVPTEKKIAVWALLANKSGKPIKIRPNHITENARNADWAFVLEIELSDELPEY